MSGYLETNRMKSNCPTCAATEVRVRMEPASKVFMVHIRHEPGCPTLEARRNRPHSPQEARS